MIELVLAGIIVVLFLVILFLFRKLQETEKSLEQLLFDKRSQSVKYGKLTEQWIPFINQFPVSPENFRFLGSPIDGVAFSEDKIVFCEFKTLKSQLSEKQKRIRDLVKRKKVEWLELNIK